MSQLEVMVVDGIIVARITESWLSDDGQISSLIREIKNLAVEHPNRGLILNFQGVNAMATIMVGELLMLQKQLEESGITFRICSLRPHVVESLQISGIYQLFKIDDNEQQGLAELKS